jgi:hypothetical protein
MNPFPADGYLQYSRRRKGIHLQDQPIYIPGRGRVSGLMVGGNRLYCCTKPMAFPRSITFIPRIGAENPGIRYLWARNRVLLILYMGAVSTVTHCFIYNILRQTL